MSVEDTGNGAQPQRRDAPETSPRRRWRTLQNRIERARRLRHAADPARPPAAARDGRTEPA